MKSWKTSVAGILVVVPIVIHLLWPAKLSFENAMTISVLFGGGGLAAAKDGNVTHTPEGDAKTVKQLKEEVAEEEDDFASDTDINRF